MLQNNWVNFVGQFIQLVEASVHLFIFFFPTNHDLVHRVHTQEVVQFNTHKTFN